MTITHDFDDIRWNPREKEEDYSWTEEHDSKTVED
jgi:hypothetical protein